MGADLFQFLLDRGQVFLQGTKLGEVGSDGWISHLLLDVGFLGFQFG